MFIIPAHINSSPISSLIRIVSFNNMGLVDKHVGVNIGCVDPVSGEVLRQSAAWFHHFRLIETLVLVRSNY